MQAWMKMLRRLHRGVNVALAAVKAADELQLLRPEMPPPPEVYTRLKAAERAYAEHADKHPELAREYETRLELAELREDAIPAVERRIKALKAVPVRNPPNPRHIARAEERLTYLRERLQHWKEQPQTAYVKTKVQRAQERVDSVERNLARMKAIKPSGPSLADIAYETQLLDTLRERAAKLARSLPETPTPGLMFERSSQPATSENIIFKVMSLYTTDGVSVIRRSTGLPIKSRYITVLGERFAKEDIFKMLGGDK